MTDPLRLEDLAKMGQSHPRLVGFVRTMPSDWRVVSATRTPAEQAEIYSWGRTKQNPYVPALIGHPFGPVATNASNACQSPHGVRSDGFSHACDIRPGRARMEDYLLLRHALEAVGLMSGASFTVGGNPDYPHAEVPGWRQVPCSPPKAA